MPGPEAAARSPQPKLEAPPAGWSPQQEIAARYPAITRLSRSLRPKLRAIEAALDRKEAAGGDASAVRLALRELRWRLEYSGDDAAARAAFERVEALAESPTRPSALASDAEGSFGAGASVWFLRFDASVDHFLQPNFDDRRRPPHFLDRVNDPDRLDAYLRGLVLSQLDEDGIDRRKELNFATAGLVRLILRRLPVNYSWHAGLEAVIRHFIADWQDPQTGFFGADYAVGGRRFRTVDLSLTFHMARYLDGRIGYWPQLIDTLITIRDRRYPNGWLDESGLTNHNNYDVAMLFRLGWPRMRPDQRVCGGREIDRLLDWCLMRAIAPDGRVVSRAVAESLPESYYFAVAFLDTVGFFDPAKRFWTGRDFPEAAPLRVRIEHQLLRLNQADPMTRMTLDRLRSV
jgi:hypothetical protein